MQKVIGYTTATHISLEDGSITKNYENLPESHWRRISKAATFLSDSGLGPTVLEIYSEGKEHREITWELITPFDNSGPPPNLEVSIENVKDQIEHNIKLLHDKGWIHGDIHINNLGTDGLRVFLLDPDTMFQIPEAYARLIQLEHDVRSEGKQEVAGKHQQEYQEELAKARQDVINEIPKWVLDWAAQGYEYYPDDALKYGESNILTRLIEADMDGWKSDWLY
jgi:hypothetical protein